SRAARHRSRLLPTGLERDFLILIDWEIVAALRVLLRLGRPVRRAAWIAVVENLAIRCGRGFQRNGECGHGGRKTGVPNAADRAHGDAERKDDRACEARHGVTSLRGT